MRATDLANRNIKEVIRDPLSLGIAIALPLLLLLTLQALGGDEAMFLTPTYLTPGIILFGFVMVMFSSAMILSRDRETSFLARLLTAPLRSSDFVLGYSLPYLLVAMAQVTLLMLVGAWLGLGVDGSPTLVALVLVLMAVFYVALGMILGALLSVAQTSGAYAVVLLSDDLRRCMVRSRGDRRGLPHDRKRASVQTRPRRDSSRDGRWRRPRGLGH